MTIYEMNEINMRDHKKYYRQSIMYLYRAFSSTTNLFQDKTVIIQSNIQEAPWICFRYDIVNHKLACLQIGQHGTPSRQVVALVNRFFGQLVLFSQLLLITCKQIYVIIIFMIRNTLIYAFIHISNDNINKKSILKIRTIMSDRPTTIFSDSILIYTEVLNKFNCNHYLDDYQHLFHIRDKLRTTYSFQGCICEFEKVREIPHPTQKTAGFCKFVAGFSD